LHRESATGSRSNLNPDGGERFPRQWVGHSRVLRGPQGV